MGKLVKIWRRVCTFFYLIIIKLSCKGKLKFSVDMRFDKGVKVEVRPKSEIVFDGRINCKRNCEFRAFNGGKLKIANGCTFNNNCFIACGEEIIIGEDTIFGPNCVIVDHDHDYKAAGGLKELKYKTDKIIIGSNVWIAANVTILKNTAIGDNVVIGAGCVVSGKVESNTVLVQEKIDRIKQYVREDKIV